MYNIVHFKTEKGSLWEQIATANVAVAKAEGFCGGRGACGKCRVRFIKEAPLPSAADRKIFSPQQLREGYRLACTAKPKADCDVEIHYVNQKDSDVTVIKEFCHENIEPKEMLKTACCEGKSELTHVTSLQDGENVPDDNGLFCAVDLGTTTVVMQLVEGTSGKVIATETFLNPQRIYGVDVLSRILAAEKAETNQQNPLQKLILTELENALKRLETVGKVQFLVFAGNMTMAHLLLGYPVTGMGEAPFTPYFTGFSEFDLCGHTAYFLPGCDTFVGSDVVAGMYACGMTEKKEMSLFIDLGTNGEMAVGNCDKVVATATAAGCTFEGDITAKLPGSDVVALAGEMLKKGIVDETGLMAEPWFETGWQPENKGAVITQQEIRSLQMAKAAICLGVQVLLNRTRTWDRIEKVYLAGGFGYYLDIKSAVEIGLIPAVLKDKCISVGNASLAGAIRLGCRFYRGEKDEAVKELDTFIGKGTVLNLAEQKDFSDKYIESMGLCPMEYVHVTHYFGPVFDEQSQILILGSVPSVKSREQQFYYGHPQNRFWKVLAAVVGCEVPEGIAERKAFLLQHHIALWDVVEECDIIGSSDSTIKNVVGNDMHIILEKAPVKKIFLNGDKAYKLYLKYCAKDVESVQGVNTEIELCKLPSTSPANAAWSMERLKEVWRVEICPYLMNDSNIYTTGDKC